MNKSAETKIVKLMKELVNRNGSDLHLTADKIPFFKTLFTAFISFESIVFLLLNL